MSAFIKRVEDFVCEHCGASVVGDGFTNHCPNCLWSKHVDNDPGDRAASCGGMMEPIDITGSTPDYKIRQKCVTCGIERSITARADDSVEAMLALIKKKAK